MPSFDTVSEVNLQEVDNAVNQTVKEIVTRYDFKGSKSTIEFDKEKKVVKLSGDDDYKLKALTDIFQSKLVKRGIGLQSVQFEAPFDAAGNFKKREAKLVLGIEQDKAREIIKSIKDTKLKVQAQIQDQKVRISGKKKDDLQEAIAFLKSRDFGIPLQFNNFRD
ncbi:MAG TPA: YajQ family cyclic di-GMP-binding protein [Deltaproteobacteria bacterium]|nr:MAG: YajQ family cyclic di-GMP-binding protein [Deltaproteobacteria bacterium GWA2_45_12]HBF13269.1 YajQ family cyclic di-GMP-binding protein [Deltaproteobacteria bacterium]